MAKQFVRLTSAAKRAVAEEIVRMTGRDEADIARLIEFSSAHLLDEFEDVQAEWLRVPLWEMFGQCRPSWKIDPQEEWDRDKEFTQCLIDSRLARV